MTKKIIAFITVLLRLGTLFAEKYQISDISYTVTSGKTRPSIIERNIEIDKTTVFQSEKELLEYIRDYEKRLLNTRHFQAAKVDFSIDQPDDSGIMPVHVFAEVADSSSLLVLPYPKYNSNSGFELKLRGRDSNFLGTLNTASASLIYAYEQSSENAQAKNKFGFEFSYNHPFTISTLNATWENSASVMYVEGDKMPEWNLRTGTSFSKKLTDIIRVNFGIFQSSKSEIDYIKYGDEYFFNTSANASLPITVVKNEKIGNVTYSPNTNVSYNYDFDGIHKENSDLISPSISVGHSISTGRVDWSDYNFRTGASLSFSQSIGYNFAKPQNNISHSITAEASAYKGYIYAGFLARAYSFYNFNGDRTEFGDRLRGIRDDQYFKSGSDKSVKSRAAIVMNFDMPLNVYSTDFSYLREWLTKKVWMPIFKRSEIPGVNKFLKLLDIDFQLSPFVDVAFLYNEETKTVFSYKDAFYAAGAELIMFPRYWRSFQFRASVGVDLGRMLLDKYINTDWREEVSNYELSIGVGLHY